MEKLRVEFARKALYLFRRNAIGAEIPALAHGEVLIVEKVGHRQNLVGEAEMQHVAVLHDVVFALKPELAGVAGTRFAIEADIVVIGNGLGADEPLLEISMDDACRLWRLGAPGDSPGTRLLRTHGEIGHEVKELVAGPDHTVEAGLSKTDCIEIFFLLGRRQYRDLAFDLGRYDDRLGTFFLGALHDLDGIFIALVGGGLFGIADVKHRLRAQEAQHAEALFLLGLAVDEPRGLAFLQQDEGALDEVELLLGFLVAAARSLLEIARPLL